MGSGLLQVVDCTLREVLQGGEAVSHGGSRVCVCGSLASDDLSEEIGIQRMKGEKMGAQSK